MQAEKNVELQMERDRLHAVRLHPIVRTLMAKQIRASARVQVTVEVDTNAWGGECTIGQLYDQAADSGRKTIEKMIYDRKDGIVRIVGEPKVIGVITHES